MKFLKKALKPLVEIFKQPINKIVHRKEWPFLFSFLDSLPSSSRILEVGCGRGYSLPVIIDHLHPSKIVAFDLDEEELKEAEKLKKEEGMENVEIKKLDATSLPFPNASFDLVLISAVLHHIKDWRKAVDEASRVLAPGGYMILKEPLKRSFEVKPINPFYRWYDGPVSLFTEQEVRKSLEDNNLIIRFWEYRGLYGKLFKCSFRAVCRKV